MTISPDSTSADHPPAIDTPPTAGGAAPSGGTRIRRILARFIGIGYLAYLAVTAAQASHEAARVAWWWPPVALVLVVGPGIALFAISFRSRPITERLIRTAAICAVAGYGAAAASWFPAWSGEAISGSSSTWLVRFSGLVGLTAALVWRPAWVGALQVAATAGSSVINQAALLSPEPLLLRVCTETVWAAGFSGVFVAAMIMAVHTSYVLDATEKSAAHTAATAAAAAARVRERAKFDALVHDRVIAVILEAARTNTPQRLPAQARAAAAALDEMATSSHEEVMMAIGVIDRLRKAITPTHESVAMSVGGIEDLTSVYPLDAVSAVTDAAVEAVRNSSLHAGAAACRVTVDITTDNVRVVITDQGYGFDPLAVAPGRLGLEHSIAGRMTQIPGGRSAITTRLGSGTIVELQWTRPAAGTFTSPGNLENNQAPRRRRTTGEDLEKGITDAVGMTSHWSIMVAGTFILCAAVAAFTSINAGMEPAAAISSCAVLTAGIGVVTAVGGDPMDRRWAALCVAAPPLQIMLATTGLSESVGDPVRNAAAISGGLVVCAFLCVRGRTGWAWTGHLASCALYLGWTVRSGLGIESATEVIVPAIAVMTAATAFAALLRPAAQEVFALRAAQAAQAAERAAADAALQERHRQIARLDELARPALDRIGERSALSDDDKQSLLLLEARLRDSIRARNLDTPVLTQAVWKARARGANVTLLDDGALETSTPDTVAQLHSSIVDHMNSAQQGTSMTVRIAPPRRRHLATVIVTTSGGESVRHEYDHTAFPITVVTHRLRKQP